MGVGVLTGLHIMEVAPPHGPDSTNQITITHRFAPVWIINHTKE